MHSYADTWAHQNFLGLARDDVNDVKRLSVKDLERASFKSFLRKLKEDVLEYAAPKLGHAQAGTIPDEPYREWKYFHDAVAFHRFCVLHEVLPEHGMTCG